MTKKRHRLIKSVPFLFFSDYLFDSGLFSISLSIVPAQYRIAAEEAAKEIKRIKLTRILVSAIVPLSFNSLNV